MKKLAIPRKKVPRIPTIVGDEDAIGRYIVNPFAILVSNRFAFIPVEHHDYRTREAIWKKINFWFSSTQV